MKYVEALNKIPSARKFPIIFLAGGITGCEDWQQIVSKGLRNKDVVILNPRRKDFPIGDPNAANEQIKWEFDMLRKSTCISFWFSKETIQPIVLFEIGSWSMFMKMRSSADLPEQIIVSVHPEYSRKQDVKIQMKFLDIKIEVCNLERHIERLREYIESWWKCEPYTDFMNYYIKEE